MKWIKRFLYAKGDLRWRIYYAFDFDSDMEKKKFFVRNELKPGNWVRVTRYGDVSKI